MNNEGLNESSGIGTGLAQVFQPYTPQYDQGEIGMVEYQNRATEQKAKQAKQEKLDKLRENISGEVMFPDYQRAYKNKADELINYVKKGDEEAAMRAKAELETIGKVGKGIYDEAKAINNIILSQGVDKFEGIDFLNKLHKGGEKIDINNIFDIAQSHVGGLGGITKKPEPFDVIKEYNVLQNVIPSKQEGRRTFRDVAMAKDGIEFAVTNDPHWNRYAQEEFAKAPPLEQKKYGGDYVEWSKEKFYKPLLLDNQTPEPKGTNVSVSVGGEKEAASPLTVSFSEQEIPIGMKAANDETPTPLKTQVLQLPADGVKIGGGLVSTDMYMVDQATGETMSLKGQGVPTLNYTQIMSLPIATKDTQVKNKKGETFVIKKGQVVQPAYKAAAKSINNADIPTENKVMAIAVDEDGNRYYQPAQNVAKSFITEFSGAKGLTFKGASLLNDMNDYAKWFKENGIDVGGYTETPSQNTGGNKGNVIDVDIDWSKYGK